MRTAEPLAPTASHWPAPERGPGGPPTAEVPVISADDELVKGFFDPEPFTDDRWRTRRAD